MKGKDMPSEKVVWVKCLFSRAGFPSERIFAVAAPGGGNKAFPGVAPDDYCYTKDKSSLLPEPPPEKWVEGYLIGLTVPGGETAGLVKVHLPNGEIYEIEERLVENKEAVAPKT